MNEREIQRGLARMTPAMRAASSAMQAFGRSLNDVSARLELAKHEEWLRRSRRYRRMMERRPVRRARR